MRRGDDLSRRVGTIESGIFESHRIIIPTIAVLHRREFRTRNQQTSHFLRRGENIEEEGLHLDSVRFRRFHERVRFCVMKMGMAL